MIVAIRPISIEDRASGSSWVLVPGEKLTREQQLALPAGRLNQMIEQRYFEEVVDVEADARAVDDLAFRVEKLERTVAQLLASQQKASTAAAKAAPRKEG